MVAVGYPLHVSSDAYARWMPFDLGPLELAFLLLVLVALGLFLRAILK